MQKEWPIQLVLLSLIQWLRINSPSALVFVDVVPQTQPRPSKNEQLNSLFSTKLSILHRLWLASVLRIRPLSQLLGLCMQQAPCIRTCPCHHQQNWPLRWKSIGVRHKFSSSGQDSQVQLQIHWPFQIFSLMSGPTERIEQNTRMRIFSQGHHHHCLGCLGLVGSRISKMMRKLN